MRLNAQQEEVIKTYIYKSGVDYDDISSEICDHMCSQVEDLMAKGVTFDSGFEMVKQRWHSIFRKGSSWWIGAFWIKPKIVLMKSEKIIKKICFQSAIVGAMICSLFYLVLTAGVVTASQIYFGIFISNFFLVILAFYTWIMLIRSGYNSVFRFIFKAKFIPLSALFFLYIWSISPVSGMQFFSIILITYNVYTLNIITFAWKHFGIKRPVNVA